MFSQKKKNYRWIMHLCIVVLTVTIVFWIISFTGSFHEKEQPVIKPESTGGADISAPSEKEKKTEFFSSYYLVKYDNHVVKIFFSDETGKMTELEDTTIVYETLSAADQEHFLRGVKISSRDELNKLIMDYES